MLYRLSGRTSKLSVENKLLVYKAVLKPIWTYGIQLWRTTANSNLEILQFQSKVLRMIVDAPWYVTNATIHRDLQMPYVKEEIQNYAKTYIEKLKIHPNMLVDLLKKNFAE